MKDIQIIMPDKNDIDELVAINTEFFAVEEQTNRALGIPSALYRNYARHISDKAYELGQALLAKKEGRIAGFLIWEDFCDPLVSGLPPDPKIYEMIEPELAFVELLEQPIREKYDFKQNDCARLMQVAVLPGYQHKGIATSLALRAIDDISARDYRFIIADCTSEFSYKILKKLGFTVVSRVPYTEFVFKGVKTFGKAKGKRRMVIKSL